MNPNASSFVPRFGSKPVVPVQAEPASAQPVEPKVETPAPKPAPVETKTEVVQNAVEEKKESPKVESKAEISEEQLNEELKRMAMEEGVTVDDLLKEDTKAEAEPAIEEKDDPREHVNLVFIGHVDAGKSTLSGQILYTTGMVDKRTIEKYEREAKDKNRESWFLAYIMDTNEEERAKGKTVEVGRASFETPTKRYTILDAPGHKNYVPNMIGGAAQADIGILVISARRGEFETGFNRGGQTREHTMLAKTLGLKYLVIVVNKMDDPTVEWAKDRFDEIIESLTPFIKQVGYNPKTDVFFVPVSGLKGTNINTPFPSGVCSWYTGNTLLGTLDDLKPMERVATAPLRVPIIDRYKDRGYTVALGKVEAGTITKGDQLVVMPGKIPVEVMGIMITEDVMVKRARPGENIRVLLKGVEEENLHKGFVLSDAKQPIPSVTKFEAQLAILELLPHKAIFSAGYSAVMHIHTAVEECSIVVILAQLDKKTGKIAKKKPMFVKNGEMCRVVIECAQPVCAELFADVQQLGRFTLRDEGKTIAIGKVISFGPKKQN